MIGPLLAATLAAAAQDAAPSDQDVRVAVVVGNNRGIDSEQPLSHAEDDARRVHALLRDLGGVDPRRAHLVLGGTGVDVLRALSEAIGRLRELSATSRTTIVFYASAHADEEALHLGGERLPIARLRAELAEAPAQLRLVIVDACRLPGEVRRKGGRPGPEVPVVLDRSVEVRGDVLLAAAGPGELAQEWAHLRGSLFTHHLLAGLRGAADYDANGKVTLTEVYAYAYRATLAKAAEAGLAPQRPSFDFSLAGFGDWVFTRTAEASAQLVLAGDVAGRVWITDRRSDIVAELEKREGDRLRLALGPGIYRVVVPAGVRAYAADVNLAYGGTRTVARNDLARVPTDRAVGKGSEAPVLVRPWGLDAAYGLGSGVLPGMAVRHGLEAGVARWIGAWRARAALGIATSSITGDRVEIAHRELRLPLSAAFTVPASIAIAGVGLEARPAWVWQRVQPRAGASGAGPRREDAFTFALGPVAFGALPLDARLDAALDLGAGMEWIPDLARDVRVRYYVQARASLAWSR